MENNKDEYTRKLAEDVLHYRAVRHLSQEKFAEMCGLCRVTVLKLEKCGNLRWDSLVCIRDFIDNN